MTGKIPVYLLPPWHHVYLDGTAGATTASPTDPHQDSGPFWMVIAPLEPPEHTGARWPLRASRYETTSGKLYGRSACA